MEVTNIKVARRDAQTEVSANLDGKPLWVRFPPEYAAGAPGDCFLAFSLLLAMVEGRGLRIDAPVSPQLVENVGKLQDILRFWHPAFQKVPITTSTAPAAPSTSWKGLATFFSGGVDSCHTFLRNLDRITHVVCIHGFDYPLTETALIESVGKSNRDVARRYGKPLIEVITNVRDFCYPHTRVALFSQATGILPAIGMALGMSDVLHAAANTYEYLSPDPTHPLTHPLWSTEATHFHLDGCDVSRSGKLEFVGRDQYLLDQLRVCWFNQYNCGSCAKCLRTRLSLRLLGLRSARLAPLQDLKELRGLRAITHDLPYWHDNLALAERVGDRAVAALLRRGISRLALRDAIREVDRHLLGSLVSRTWRKVASRKQDHDRFQPEDRINF